MARTLLSALPVGDAARRAAEEEALGDPMHLTRRITFSLLALAMAASVATVGAGPVRALSGDGMIYGFIFNDRDRDGVRDPGEETLARTVVCVPQLDWCDHTEAGEYMFDLLDAGAYRVVLADYPDGYRPTTDPSVRVQLDGAELRALDFGVARGGALWRQRSGR